MDDHLLWNTWHKRHTQTLSHQDTRFCCQIYRLWAFYFVLPITNLHILLQESKGQAHSSPTYQGQTYRTKNFYKNASVTISDRKGREAFLRMANEEEAHFKYLRQQYQSILKEGNFDFTKSFVKESHEQTENPIFSHEIKDRVKDCHYEVSVLTIGMKLELEAINFYQSCAKKAETPEEKQFYPDLVDWETHHYEALEWELNNLKEEYWRTNNFVPIA